MVCVNPTLSLMLLPMTELFLLQNEVPHLKISQLEFQNEELFLSVILNYLSSLISVTGKGFWPSRESIY